jgi:hypothetical protein
MWHRDRRHTTLNSNLPVMCPCPCPCPISLLFPPRFFGRLLEATQHVPGKNAALGAGSARVYSASRAPEHG